MKSLHVVIALTLFGGFWNAGLTAQQQHQLFTVKQVMSAPFPTNLTTAPVEDRIAWVFNQEGIRNIWIADGPVYAAQKLTGYTLDDGQDIGNLTFSPDGKTIYFVRGSGANRQGEIPNPVSHPDGAKQEIYSVQIADKKIQLLGEGAAPAPSPDGKSLAYLKKGQAWIFDLTVEKPEAKQLFSIRGSAGSLRWSPVVSDRKLAFTSNRGDHGYIGIYDFSSNTIQYLSPSLDTDNNPVWSPDGQKLAFLRVPNSKFSLPFIPEREGLGWSVMIADIKSGTVNSVWKAPKGPGSAFQGISADNQLFWGKDDRIVFPWEGDGWLHLYSAPANGGEATLLTPGQFEVQNVELSADGSEILYDSNQDDIDRKHVWRVPVSGGKPMLVTPSKGIEWSPVQTRSNKDIFVLASSGNQPAHPAKVGTKGEIQWLAPSQIPSDFPFQQLVEPQQIIYAASDGMKIHGQLFLPRNMKAGEKYPAIVFFHGGSRRQMLLGFHPMGYYHNSYALNQLLANQGYIVLSSNYRSGTGYGLNFREALNYGANGASEYYDVMGAGLYLRNRPDVDPGRIGLWGGSYGGYLTALGLARASDLFAAGVDIHGVHDWNVVIRNFVPGYDATKREDVAKLAYESSPMADIDTWRSPVLIIHGDDDRNVPFSESVDLAEALRRKGDVHFEQLVFPDEVHGFLLHRNWLAAFEASADFFQRFLKKKP